MRFLRASVALFLLTGMSPTVGAASAETKWRPPALRGVTTIVGDQVSSMKVRLTKPVDPNGSYEGEYDKQPPFDLRGDGRLVGFLLTKVGQGIEPGEGPSLFGWRLGRCRRPACETKGFLTWVLSSKLEDGLLPSGTYRLYLIADGARARVRIEFAGLTGETRLAPARGATARLRTLPLNQSTGVDDTIYWSGKHAPFEGAGFSLTEMWVDRSTEDEAIGVCAYDVNRPPEDEHLAYMPPCPAADVSEATFSNADHNEIGYVSYPGKLPFGAGVWRSITADSGNVGAIQFWLKFN